MTSQPIVDQPPPLPNGRPSIQSLVRGDLEERERIGIERYGTPLQAHNGRDALVDAYQEAMDLVMYLRQMIEERAEAETRLRAQVLREAAARLDPGPRRPGTEAGFDRGMEAGKRAAANFLREWAGLVKHGRAP